MIIFTDSKSAIMPLDKVVLECIKKYKPNAIYLREKELDDKEYTILASRVMNICNDYNVDFFVCHRADIARQLGVRNLHTNLNNMSKIGTKSDFDKISVSIHDASEVEIAQKLGATNLVYGHIYQTSCKQGLPPRGTKSLKNICNLSSLPVIAIGGINKHNYSEVLDCGATDFAIMSSGMNLTF